MKFKPFEEETIVSARSQEEIVAQLSRFTHLVTDANVPARHIFNGNIEKDTFRISLKVNFPQNALPLAIGKIEPTSKGSIVFLKYQLFPATKVMLGVVGGIMATICISFFLIYLENHEPKYIRAIIITLATGAFYYMTLIVNFFKRKNQTKSTLERILNE
ncbi:MAG: hypothetical protein KI791_04325 [Cyclobacteriaceae bacterium]|nr:hypothetical protein [Cyclobacteriaceae bacterium SS2]